ncbi:MAG: hypothetical protein U9P42_04885 [Candidatus Fermentibacteria bacterium]|nr:hypothetical protein [Candidatus Fermentibacteria bacterium]
MNKIIMVVLLLLTTTLSAGHLRLEDSGYDTIAYIREDGRIEDASFLPLGRILYEEDTDRFRIEDASFNTLGYVEGNEFLDSFEDRVFELTSDGRLKNHRFRDVAIIRNDGTVEALNFSVILYTDGSNDDLAQRIAVYMIYFSDLLE